jgi:hypothetical protein
MIADGILIFLMIGAGIWSARLSVKSAIENSTTPNGCIQYMLNETYLVTGILVLLYVIGGVDTVVMTMFIVRKAELLVYDYSKLIQNYHTLKEGNS